MIRWIMAALLLTAGIATAQDAEWETGIGQKDQVTRGLVAYWAMRNSGTTVFDEWGAYNAGASNGVTFGTSYAAVGYGARFDGTNDYVDTANIGYTTVNMTYAAWINVGSSTGNDMHILDNDGGGTPYATIRSTAASRAFWAMRDASGQPIQLTGPVLASGWNFVCGVRSATNSYLYVNAVLTTNAANVNLSGSLGLNGRDTIGATFNGGTRARFFRGNIDEARIYNVALTADEIKQLYRMGAIPKGIK
jgi:hypothetical protein